MTQAATLKKAPYPEELEFLFAARAASSLLEACLELGVLERLGRGPVDAQTLALDCGIREETAPALLNALVSLGLVQAHEHGTYRSATDDLEWFLEILRRWDGFADGLRYRPEALAAAPPDTDAAFRRSAKPLATLWGPAIAKAEEELAPVGRRVLDLGAGAVPWSLALVAADPAIQVTAVELPGVLSISRQAAAAAGCEANFHFIGEDVFTVGLDDGAFDLVILSSLCHLFDEPTNRGLLNRVARWLAPGGTVAIIDFLSNERRDGPRDVVLYAIELVRRIPTGQVYPFSSYAGWLRAAGCERVERLELSAWPPLTMVRARRA